MNDNHSLSHSKWNCKYHIGIISDSKLKIGVFDVFGVSIPTVKPTEKDIKVHLGDISETSPETPVAVVNIR